MPGKFMVSAGFILSVALGAARTPAAGAPAAAEYNPIRRPPISIGPEAHRLIVAFRALPGGAVVKTVPRPHVRGEGLTQAWTAAADALALARRVQVPVAGSRQFTPSMHVLLLPRTLYGADVEAALEKLRTDPAVQFAEVDQIRYAHSVLPNDPLLVPTPGATGQWYMDTPSSAPVVLEGNTTEDLAATDAISAWSITTGSSGVVIADVDSGVRFDHPDLLRAGFGGRLLPGYDFVGQDYNPTTGAALGTFLMANDGDGWDPDPSDPGDWIDATDLQNALFASDTAAPSSWHGTRVVGLFGAIGNNDVGIAAMTWGSWILPVRALGKGGGYDSDIIAGIEWAVGLPVTNPDGSPVPANPYPADIVNLSLGGSGTCSSDYENVLLQVTQMGVLVVASAGNGGTPGATAPVDAPASCATLVPGVMAVVGLRNVGTKVGYSSFGPQATIAAPAGNCVQTSGACLRSIDTTTNAGTTVPGENGYTDETDPNLGTSFSAPIVSGIAALMRSVNNNLTPSQLIARMQASATAFPGGAAGVPICPANDATSGECVCPNLGSSSGNQCGTGMVNALSAVKAAQKPIGVIVIPAEVIAGSVLDASASVAGCGGSSSAPAPLSIVSYRWSASPSSLIVSGADTPKVTIDPAPGTLTLTITDSAGNIDAETVAMRANSAWSAAPASSGTRATACPAALTVAPAAPTVSEAFSPDSVEENGTSTLVITLANSNRFALTQASLEMIVPSGLTIPATPAVASSCTGAQKSLTNTTTSLHLSAANVPAGGTCVITLPVQSATAGAYTASIAAKALVTATAGANSAGSNAALTVIAPRSGGGGTVDWLDLLFVLGVLLAVRRPAMRPFNRGRTDERRRR
jgi:serine protease